MNPWQGILELAGLQADFEILDVKQYRESKKVYFYLRRKDRAGYCSCCGQRSSRIHSTDQVQLRDLSIFEYTAFLIVERFTVRCQRCHRFLVEDFWLWRSRKDHTWRYERKVSRMCEEMTNVAVARLEGLNDKTVFNIDFELLQIRLHHQKLPALGPNYSMDEVYFKYFPNWHARRNEAFVTNLLDLQHRKVISNSPGRDKKAAKNCLLWLSPEQREEAQNVAVDLHDPYIAAIHKNCPNANIVLDRFHIMKLFSESMNEFRKQQMNLTDNNEEVRLLQGRGKWLLLTRPEKLSKKNHSLLEELKALNERVVDALLVRDSLVDFFESESEAQARKRWETLLKLVKEVDIKPFNEFFERLKVWIDYIWNFFECRISSAVIEAINHKIKTVKAMAYGYRNLFYFRLKILQRVGFLNSRFAELPKLQGKFA